MAKEQHGKHDKANIAKASDAGATSIMPATKASTGMKAGTNLPASAGGQDTWHAQSQPAGQARPANQVQPLYYDYDQDGESEKSKGHKKVAIILGSIFGALAVIYVAASVFFMYHFLPNTVINDVDCSYKTAEEVQGIVQGQVEDYRIDIIERSSNSESAAATTEESISGSDIDIAYVEDGKVEQLLDGQNHWTWPASLFKKNASTQTMHATVTYDNDKLKTAIDALTAMDATKMIAPVNAYPEFNGTQYVVHAESLGTTIDTNAIYSVIGDAIENTQESVDLDSTGCYVAPDVISTTQTLLDTVALYNKYVPYQLTYTFGSKTEVLTGETILTWFDMNDDGTATLNEDKLTAWLSDFGSRHDTVGTTRTITLPNGEVITGSGGTYGWSIDEDAEKDAIEEMLAGNAGSITRDPIYVQTAASWDTNGDIGTSYIDLNLTTQHMRLIKDNAIVFEADVVTGLPVPSKITSDGVFDILDMQSPYTMTGEITAGGVPEYVTTCSYWMRMTWSGMGFHDATWQPWFGGDRYTYAGSHGCINMSYSDAQTLYGLVWVGLPIISHY